MTYYVFELREDHEKTNWWQDGGKYVWGDEGLSGITYYEEYGIKFLTKLSKSGDWTEAIKFSVKGEKDYQDYLASFD